MGPAELRGGLFDVGDVGVRGAFGGSLDVYTHTHATATSLCSPLPHHTEAITIRYSLGDSHTSCPRINGSSLEYTSPITLPVGFTVLCARSFFADGRRSSLVGVLGCAACGCAWCVGGGMRRIRGLRRGCLPCACEPLADQALPSSN